MDYDPVWKHVPFRFDLSERFSPYYTTKMVNKEMQLIRSHSSLGRLLRRPLRKYTMTEGRRSQVVLLDERRLEILIQPKLYAGELLDIVASHFRLKEKEYFGLAYIDDSGHYNWLHLDHRVLDHDFPRKGSGAGSPPLVLHFLVKFFVEGISQLRNSVTVELFYLQARSLIFKGQIEVDSDVAFELASHALQATYGDYVDDATCRSNLKKVPLLPSSVLKDKPSIAWCEDKVIAHYRKLAGQSRGFAIVNYMSLIEGLPTYGVHYYEVKDKVGSKWWLGLSYKGISQYEITNQKVAKKVFQWRHLENLYFRDRKFSIEVHDPKRITHALSSFNLYEDAIEEPVDNFDELSDAICDPTTQVSVSRRTFGPGNVTVLVWFAANPTLTKAIWSMAISQHQFYLDRKQSKNSSSSIRRLSEIAKELSTSRQSLSTTSSASNLSRSGSVQSLNTTLPNGGTDDTEPSEAARAARLEMLAALKARKDALEEKLKERTNKLKLLCLEEAEIIGVLPPETPLAPGEQKPQIRRRMGTSFTLPENLINKLISKEEEDVASMELEYEIQKRITSAALKLANDMSTKKSMRKQRKINYQQSETKLKGIEQKLLFARNAISQKSHSRGQIKKKQPRPSLGDLGDNVRNRSADDGDSVFNVEAVNLSNLTSPVPPGTPSSGKSSKLDEDSEKHSLRTVSQSPRSERHLRNPSHSSASSTCTSLSHGRPSTPTSPCRPPMAPSSRTTSPSRFVTSGYIPSSIYQTRSTYRNQQYPTFSTRTQRCHSEYDNVSNSSSTSSGTFSPLYKNKYDAAILVESRGLYNVPMQRTSQVFYSQEELDNMRAGSGSVSSGGSGMSGGYNTAPTHGRRHHSVSNSNQRYGSLDRTFSTVPHVKIESRSLDNLDNPEDEESGTCIVEHSDVVDGGTPMTLPIETHFGAVVGRVTHEYPLSPPLQYEGSYCSDDVPDSQTAVAFPNAMQSHLPIDPKLLGLHSQRQYPDMHNQLSGGYLPPRPAYDQPRRSMSHQSLPNTRQQPLRQSKQQHEQIHSSAYHHVVLYDNVTPVASCNPATRRLSPLSYQHPVHKTQRLPSPSSSSLSSSEVPQFVTNSTTDTSPKAKEKEWYETSLDSPLSPRRHSSSSSDRMLPKSTSPLVAAISPGSPVRACSRSSSLLSPRGDSAMNRFSPSPSSFDQDQSVFLQVPFESTQNCTVVSVGQFQPYREETKPYELSDYYKYSTKVRKQQQQCVDNQQNETVNNNVGVGGGHDICNNSSRSMLSPRPVRLANHNQMEPLIGNRLSHHKIYPCRPVSPDSRRSPFPTPRKARDANTFQVTSPHLPVQSPFARQNVYLPSLPGSDILQPDEPYATQHQGIYSPPRPMTCEPIQHSPQRTPISSPTTMRNNSLIKSRDNSFTLESGTSLADAFHDEMLAWYEDQETAKQKATLV